MIANINSFCFEQSRYETLNCHWIEQHWYCGIEMGIMSMQLMMRRFCSTPVCVRSLSIRPTLYPCTVQRDPTTLGSVCQRDPTSLGSVCYKSTSPAVKPTTSYLPAFSLVLVSLSDWPSCVGSP
eukprot:sb/3475754/